MAKRCILPFLAAAAAALLAGCSSVGNLTPSRYPRTENGFYRVEAQWNSNSEAIRANSFRPEVVVGLKTYPMQPVPLVQDRWEAYIPVEPGEKEIVYHFRFDYVENGFYHPKQGSADSPDYTLKIGDRK
jgi:hypothetical protein